MMNQITVHKHKSEQSTETWHADKMRSDFKARVTLWQFSNLRLYSTAHRLTVTTAQDFFSRSLEIYTFNLKIGHVGRLSSISRCCYDDQGPKDQSLPI